MSGLWQDIRYSSRTFRRHAATSIVAIAVIALGVGANAAMFSAVRGVLMTPLPYAHPDRLVVLEERNTSKNLEHQRLSPARYFEWRDARQVFSELAAYDTSERNLTGLGEPDRIHVARVSADLFSLTGVSAHRGRVLGPEDERLEAPAVAMVSHDLWRLRMGGRVIEGETLGVDGRVYPIVGVMPDGFALPKADVYVALVVPFRHSRVSRHLYAVGRLADGVDLTVARERVSQAAASMEKTYPDTDAGWTATLMPLGDVVVGKAGSALRVLMGLAALLLLITGANVGNLLLMLASGRSRELAIRIALGAPQRRIVQQLLVESALIVAVGGVIGVTLAAWLAQPLRMLPFPRFDEIRIDATVVMFTAAATGLTGVVVGAILSSIAARTDVAGTLAAGGREPLINASSRAFGRTIVGVQAGLAVTLAIPAALLVASVGNLTRVDLGFQPENVLTGRMTFPRTRYRNPQDLRRFERALRERTASIPGVVSADVVNTLPLGGRDTPFNVLLEDRRADTHAGLATAEIRVASPGYFPTMRIPLVAGRAFDERDTADASPVMVVNRAMATRFWANENPIGRRVSISGPGGPWITIVGLVGDVRHGGPAEDPRPEMYLPIVQHTWPGLTLVLRTEIRPLSLIPEVRRAVAALDSELPIYDLSSMDDRVGDALRTPRFLSLLASAFAGVAVILALTGVFGVMSHNVTQRIPELATRMALGAKPGGILSLVIVEGLRPLTAGIVAGTAGAWTVARVISGFLFGLGPAEPGIFVAATGLVLTAGVFACYLPARRAARVDPAAILRQ